MMAPMISGQRVLVRRAATGVGTGAIGVDALAAALRSLRAAGPRRLAYSMEGFRIEAKRAQIEAFYRDGLAHLRGA